MIKRCIIFIYLISFLWIRPTYGQAFSRYNSFSIGVNEGLLQSTMIDLAFDSNNFCWMSYPNGIQRFDGKTYHLIPVQPGLPDNKHCRFFKSQQGSFLISHTRGISRYDDQTNKFELHYQHPGSATTPAMFLGENKGIIYFYTDAAEIIGMDARSFVVQSKIKTGLPGFADDFTYGPNVSGELIHGNAAMIISKSIYIWSTDSGKFIYQSKPFPDLSSYLIKHLSDHELLFFRYSVKGTLFILNTRNNQIQPLPLSGFEQTVIGRAYTIHWQNKVLLSINDRLYETDSTLRKIRSEIVNWQNEAPAKNATIHKLVADNFGNLFLRTINGGIRKLVPNNYPLRNYSVNGAGNNFILSVFADKENNRVLAGVANYGLVISDTNQQGIKKIPLTDNEEKISPNTIIRHHTGDYYIFAHRAKCVWKLSKDIGRLTRIPLITKMPPEKTGISYFSKLLYQDDQQAVVISETKFYKLDLVHDKVYEFFASNGYIMSGIHISPFFIVHYNDAFVLFDEKNFTQVKRIPFPNTGGVRCYLKESGGRFYIGTNKGIFLTDSSGRVIQHWNKETGMPDECIYAMAFDHDKNIWCSTNKGILRLNNGRLLLHLRKEDGLQENEFNTNVVHQSGDGDLFFGGVNGYNGFNPAGFTGVKDNIRLLVTSILVNNNKVPNNQADWQIEKIRLPYNQNAVSFDFVAMGNHPPDQYEYQYQLKGVDTRWLKNEKMQTVRYSLSPGRYEFQLYASRSYREDAIPMKRIQIIIDPPFWQSWWFRICMGILAVFSLYFLISRRYRRMYASKLIKLEHEKNIQLEREKISRNLHDSLGAYANAILYNAELLEKENDDKQKKELITHLKFASKDIITSLRETVWALSKKQYTGEECLIRIKNYIQPLAKYYSHIQFRVEGNAPPDSVLHYAQALNLVRILQEAVSNSIKHANPTSITVFSEPMGNNWKLEVKDNGSGFDTNRQLEEISGNGLRNMEHRAKDSGFDWKLSSDLRNGTSITIIIPHAH